MLYQKMSFLYEVTLQSNSLEFYPKQLAQFLLFLTFLLVCNYTYGQKKPVTGTPVVNPSGAKYSSDLLDVHDDSIYSFEHADYVRIDVIYQRYQK